MAAMEGSDTEDEETAVVDDKNDEKLQMNETAQKEDENWPIRLGKVLERSAFSEVLGSSNQAKIPAVFHEDAPIWQSKYREQHGSISLSSAERGSLVHSIRFKLRRPTPLLCVQISSMTSRCNLYIEPADNAILPSGVKSVPGHKNRFLVATLEQQTDNPPAYLGMPVLFHSFASAGLVEWHRVPAKRFIFESTRRLGNGADVSVMLVRLWSAEDDVSLLSSPATPTFPFGKTQPLTPPHRLHLRLAHRHPTPPPSH
eukprot:GABV01008968.1.p1 GENE.GABV01008968.1~~GABV01008968.1.p1  ORF type:complete len:282 (-),score=85.38 GABV01008968.1:37-807(-)